MPDIFCQSCAEPWDADHLRHDAIDETALDAHARRAFDGRLTPALRRAFAAVGYDFGSSIYSLRACPSCPKGVKRSHDDRYREAIADATVTLLGDDLDAILVTLTDEDAKGEARRGNV